MTALWAGDPRVPTVSLQGGVRVLRERHVDGARSTASRERTREANHASTAGLPAPDMTRRNRLGDDSPTGGQILRNDAVLLSLSARRIREPERLHFPHPQAPSRWTRAASVVELVPKPSDARSQFVDSLQPASCELPSMRFASKRRPAAQTQRLAMGRSSQNSRAPAIKPVQRAHTWNCRPLMKNDLSGKRWQSQ